MVLQVYSVFLKIVGIIILKIVCEVAVKGVPYALWNFWIETNTQRQKTLRVGLECSSWVAWNGGDMQATTTAATHACAYIA